jgi:hypothetical protein
VWTVDGTRSPAPCRRPDTGDRSEAQARHAVRCWHDGRLRGRWCDVLRARAARRTAARDHPARAVRPGARPRERLSVTAGELELDFSKNLLDDAAVEALVALARDRGLPERIEAMFAASTSTATEDRAVLHTALRRPPTPRSSSTART